MSSKIVNQLLKTAASPDYWKKQYRQDKWLVQSAAKGVKGLYNAMSSKKRKATNQHARKKRSKVVADGIKVGARGGASRVVSVKKSKKSAGRGTLKKRLAQVEKTLSGTTSYLYVRRDYVLAATAALGKAEFYSVPVLYSGVIRSDIGGLDIGTGATVDITAVAENTQLMLKNIWSCIDVVNTTDTPCCVDIYACVSKSNTGAGVSSTLLAQIADMGFSVSGSQVDPQVFPSDIPDFAKQYTIIGHTESHMRGGDILQLKATIPDFKWSDDYYDDFNVEYLKTRNLQYMVRVRGHVCYDSNSASRISYIPAQLSAIARLNYTVQYAGNVSSRKYRYVSGLSTGTFTGTPTTVGPNVVALS